MAKQYPESPSTDNQADESVYRDHPEAYIARDRRQALSKGVELPERVEGSALFADISGFTPLTEALRNEFGPQRGAEELTRHLNRVFHAVISELDRYGGNVIYFAGDAITCWFDTDDGRKAIACGLAMQKAIQRVGRVVIRTGVEVQMALKVAIAVGKARRAVVGNPDIQYIDVLAGQLLDHLAQAEHHTMNGEVVLDETAIARLGDRVKLSEQRIDSKSGRKLGVVASLNIEVTDTPIIQPPPLDPGLVKPWLLPAVYDRITAGRGELVGELRPSYPVFIRFGGIDFEDDDAMLELNDFVIHAQRIFDNFGGNVLQLTLGDKGAYLYGVFGSPQAHEDDAARAASAALALQTLDQVTAARDIQIGVSYGALFSGTYGHEMRRTFVCLGDAVNLAARLMSAAPVGRIYVADDVREATGDSFIWEPLEPLQLKGKAKPVSASVLVSSLTKVSRRKTRFELPLVGREEELSILESGLDQVLESRGQVIGVCAEAGLGKSRLVAEFVRNVRRRNLLVAFGESQSFGVNTSYHVWREIWHRLLEVDEEAEAEVQRAAIVSALTRIDPALVQRAPLLSEIFAISIDDTELTASFDAKLRKSSLENLLAICLRDKSIGEPIVIVIEDAHWIDALSHDLLEALIRASADLRVLFVIAYRPPVESAEDLQLQSFSGFKEISLQELNPEQMASVITSKSEQLFGRRTVPSKAFIDLIVKRAQGNPFYAEELLNFFASKGVVPTDIEALQGLDLPDSLNNLVLSRIDALAEDPRRTLKVASVIGRLFQASSIPGVYPDLGTYDQILEQLDILQSQDLLSLDQAETLSYLFKHVVTHEVSYNSLPFAIRAGLHRRVGEYIEQTESDDLDPRYDLLAHHFWNSDDDEKKRKYLKLAEESARRRYANKAAIDYGERLTSLVTGTELGEVVLRLGKVYELIGDWVRAQTLQQQAYEIADEVKDMALKARCEVALAEIARKQGNYDEAVERLGKAAETFKTLCDNEGLGLTLHVSGTVAAQKGDYSAAQEAYEGSLEISQQLNDHKREASLYSNLAIIAEYLEDYTLARSHNERALKIRREIGDRWGIGVSQNNLGMIELHQQHFLEARTRFDETMRLGLEVGDNWMVALAKNNLGNANRELGDFNTSKKFYAASLEAYSTYDDQWAMAFLLEDIAILAAQVGEGCTAFELVGAADTMREEIGSPRSPAQEEELQKRLSETLKNLDMQNASSAREQGRRHSISSATRFGLSFTGADN